jgi:hypothetical protein
VKPSNLIEIYFCFIPELNLKLLEKSKKMEEKIASLWEQLTSNNKLDRDRGNQQLELDLKINKDLGKDIRRMDSALNEI